VLQLVPARSRERLLRSRSRARARSLERHASVPKPTLRGRALSGLGLVMTVLGVLVLADAVVSLVWQEPISALYAKARQDHLRGALRAEERAAPTALERRTLIKLPDQASRISFLASELQHRARQGSAVGRIRIPSIGVDFVVVKGTSTADLRSGPGIFGETRFPGIAGTTAIAGHRTTYLAPFRHIDRLHAGNRILLRMPYARFTYTVTGKRVVAPTNVRAAVAQVGYSRLVLSACTPLFSAAKRLLVFARLTATVPLAGARSGARSPRASPPARAHRAARRPPGPPLRGRPS
jgi:sortase A